MVHVDRLLPFLMPQPEDSLVALFDDVEQSQIVEPSQQPNEKAEDTRDFKSQMSEMTQTFSRSSRTWKIPAALEPYILE